MTKVALCQKRTMQTQELIRQPGDEYERRLVRFFFVVINIRPGNAPCVVFPINRFVAKFFIEPGSCRCKQHNSTKLLKD
ncbi:hypothetical protein Y888_13855 [Mixta calida B021323]|nr:hypothetical protein Y888_13855 [Mixta calida B021323]